MQKVNSRKTGSNNLIGEGIKLLSIIVLLLVYLIGTVEFTSFHSAIHPADEVGLHSESNESNACHQSIYHNVTGKNCEHPAHIVAIKKCSLCQLSIQSQDILFGTGSVEFTYFSAPLFDEGRETLQGKLFSLDPARAPPIV